MTTSSTISKQKVKGRLKGCFKTTQYPPAVEFHSNVEITPIKIPLHRFEQSILDTLFQAPFGAKPKPLHCFPLGDRKTLLSCSVINVRQWRWYSNTSFVLDLGLSKACSHQSTSMSAGSDPHLRI